MKHLIFFDDHCPLCRRSVKTLFPLDRSHLFYFAPLEGKTAEQRLVGKIASLRNENSLILMENFNAPVPRIWLRGRAVFRIFWLLGGKWKLIGWLCFIPFGVDLIYRFIARHRHFLHIEGTLPSDNRYFLP